MSRKVVILGRPGEVVEIRARVGKDTPIVAEVDYTTVKLPEAPKKAVVAKK